MTLETSRRGFLKGATAATAVLLVGVRPDGAIAAGTDGSMLNPFVKIGSDGSVTAIIKHFEKGQGPATGLSTLIAEEMGLDMDQIGYEFAPSDPSKYNNLLFGQFQGTGGSTAMANSFEQYRTAGAAAREMLIAAAAQEWGVDAGTLSLSGGVISGGGKSAPLGDFVATAATLTPPEAPRLTDPADWRLIGNAATRRLDTPPKINGTAMFAMDVHLDNQMVTVIKRCACKGGVVASFDDSAARSIRGFIRAATLPNNAGVAVYAEDTWSALQARDAVDVEWDMTNAETRSSEEIRDELLAAVRT